jgi:hypothetical protein
MTTFGVPDGNHGPGAGKEAPNPFHPDISNPVSPVRISPVKEVSPTPDKARSWPL